MMKKIKLIIAKEGLIVIGLAVVIYLFISFVLQKVPVALPKYRLEFANGEIHTIKINPEIRNDYDYKKLLEEAYNPPPKFVERRVKEFIKAGNIKSTLNSSRCVNLNLVYLSKLYSRFLGVPFILRLAIVYIILLCVRFIFWAMKTLRKK